MLSSALWIIALIAILIAMIGVVNTVLMSVFERFKEIGILKSLGAMPFDIFKLVWIETIILCFSGAIIGNVFALGLSKTTDVLIRSLLPYAPTGSLVIIDTKLVILTTVAIILIGVISGIYPALKASGIKPIESIKGGN